MAEKDILIIIMVVAIILVVYAVCAAAIECDTFNQVKVEISRARNERERRYWKKKFWITCLKIIPFGYLIIKLTRIDKK